MLRSRRRATAAAEADLLTRARDALGQCSGPGTLLDVDHIRARAQQIRADAEQRKAHPTTRPGPDRVAPTADEQTHPQALAAGVSTPAVRP